MAKVGSLLRKVRPAPLDSLERLTVELEDLAQMLRQETRTRARWIIMQRVHEIISQIGKGLEE